MQVHYGWCVVLAVIIQAATVNGLSAVHPDHARREFPRADSTGDVLNGQQAQAVYIQMMEAIVNANMTALAEVCDDNMTFVVEGWAPNADRAPDACWPRGKAAFVAHVHGFVTLFNLSVAWIERSTAAYDTVFVDVGFSFVGGPQNKLVVAPQTMQILRIVKDKAGVWKIGYFLEIGSWHTSARDTLMVNTWMTLAKGISTTNMSLFAPYLAPNLTALPFVAGATSAPTPLGRSEFLKMVQARWNEQVYGSVVTAHAFASCRFAWATATFPWIDKSGGPHVFRLMFMFEFEYGALMENIPLITKWWQAIEEIPGNPYPVPPRLPNPSND